jgi:hypothetical protein
MVSRHYPGILVSKARVKYVTGGRKAHFHSGPVAVGCSERENDKDVDPARPGVSDHDDLSPDVGCLALDHLCHTSNHLRRETVGPRSVSTGIRVKKIVS